tara:strand:+ start:441 stop:815 length:375 start_codon:yes stop_codon:yes gene_type:complete
MFANKELEKSKRLLNWAIEKHAHEIISLDPAIRRLRLIAMEMQQRDLNDLKINWLTDDDRECGYVLGKVLKRVKDYIKTEENEGENYLDCLGVLPSKTDFSLYRKRLDQVKEDFPLSINSDSTS